MDNVGGGFRTDMICCSVMILILRVTLFYHQDQHWRTFAGLIDFKKKPVKVIKLTSGMMLP